MIRSPVAGGMALRLTRSEVPGCSRRRLFKVTWPRMTFKNRKGVVTAARSPVILRGAVKASISNELSATRTGAEIVLADPAAPRLTMNGAPSWNNLSPYCPRQIARSGASTKKSLLASPVFRATSIVIPTFRCQVRKSWPFTKRSPLKSPFARGSKGSPKPFANVSTPAASALPIIVVATPVPPSVTPATDAGADPREMLRFPAGETVAVR